MLDVCAEAGAVRPAARWPEDVDSLDKVVALATGLVQRFVYDEEEGRAEPTSGTDGQRETRAGGCYSAPAALSTNG